MPHKHHGADRVQKATLLVLLVIFTAAIPLSQRGLDTRLPPLGDIVTVIDAAKGAGVTRVGVITEGMRRAAAEGA